jgi:flagellar motility protein MotE (MotC chaperone)
MSSRFAFAAGVLFASLAALPLSAQQSSSGTLRDTSATKPPSAQSASTDSALVDLGRAITELAMSVQKVVDQAKNNPEVRRAALQTASTAVSVAQKTLEQNQSEIERLLAEASRKIAEMNEDMKSKQAAPKKSEGTKN